MRSADTVTGTPMGRLAASAADPGAFHHSTRYDGRQTYTVKNIAAAAVSPPVSELVITTMPFPSAGSRIK